MFGGFTVDERCEESPWIAPLAPGKPTRHFKVGNGRAISPKASGF